MEEKNTVPYIIHEGCLARDERTIKKLVIALILTIVLMFASNGIWLYAWMQYDYEGEIVTGFTTTTTTQDGDGINICGSGSGDINYGSEDNGNDHPKDSKTKTEKEKR